MTALGEDVPDWLPGWCADHMGGEPVAVLFVSRSMSAVFGLRSADGRDVVVKAREDGGRASSCVAAQAVVTARGFRCARPLTPAVAVGGPAVHAEEHRPGGEVLRGESPEVAVRYAAVFARLMAEFADVAVPPPVPNPRWARWDHGTGGCGRRSGRWTRGPAPPRAPRARGGGGPRAAAGGGPAPRARACGQGG
ncbi:hypothetical protein ACFYOT_24475, partial [Saccharothrix saharensis]